MPEPAETLASSSQRFNDTISDILAIDDAPPFDASAELQAHIETVREAQNIVIPELVATAQRCPSDALQQLAEREALLKLSVGEKFRRHREHLVELNELQLAKSAWKVESMARSKDKSAFSKQCESQHQLIIMRYRSLLEHLDLAMRLQPSGSEPGIWKLEFTYADCGIVFIYDEDADAFELVRMTPELSIFKQVRQILQDTNDVKSVLCAWRNFCHARSETKPSTDPAN